MVVAYSETAKSSDDWRFGVNEEIRCIRTELAGMRAEAEEDGETLRAELKTLREEIAAGQEATRAQIEKNGVVMQSMVNAIEVSQSSTHRYRLVLTIVQKLVAALEKGQEAGTAPGGGGSASKGTSSKKRKRAGPGGGSVATGSRAASENQESVGGFFAPDPVAE
jgi:hypothetical protein